MQNLFFKKGFAKKLSFAWGDAVGSNGIIRKLEKEVPVTQVINIADAFANILSFGGVISLCAGEDGEFSPEEFADFLDQLLI